ncbi:MAG: hypothetical protein ACXW24_15835 [Telluria sp.]
MPVSVYDDDEFEEILKLHGMKRDHLHQSLQSLARTPRLFPLVYQLKDNAALKSDATVHRLLFEYGRDVLEQREGSAFTAEQWAQWLAGRALKYLASINHANAFAKSVSIGELEGSLAAPSLTPEHIRVRLSEVVDGNLFFEQKRQGVTTHLVLRKEAGVLGLALALLETLDLNGGDVDAHFTALEEWIEPIGAIDQTAEILRAALSVISAGAGVDGDAKSDAILVTWINIQNPNATYETDVSVFGDSMPRSMLTVVERSSIRVRDAARHLSIQSLRRLPIARVADWKYIEHRLVRWASQLVVPRPENVADESHYAKGHYEATLKRIGTASPGDKVVLGVLLHLNYQHSTEYSTAIPGILEGHDLSQFREVLLTAAIREASQVGGLGNTWNGFHWLASVGTPNESDTHRVLTELSEKLLQTPGEKGVHPRLRNRAAALLLRISGDEKMEIRASEIDEPFENNWSYKEDYADDPVNSFFELERRHVDAVLAAESLGVRRRLDKIDGFVADPTIVMPNPILEEMKASLHRQMFDHIHQGASHTSDDHNWERNRPRSARFAPEEFCDAARRELQALASRRGEQKYWAAIRVSELLLVVQPDDARALSDLRNGTQLHSNEQIMNTFCLQLEILHLSLEAQLEALLQAANYHATNEMLMVVRPASPVQLAAFLQTHPQSQKAERLVLEIMAVQRTPEAEQLCTDLLHTLESSDPEVRNISFMALARCAPEICGQRLLSKRWKVDEVDAFQAHYGSEAIAKASAHIDFIDVLPLVAPWRWLDTAVIRGSDLLELREASSSLVRLVFSAVVDLPELPGEISVRPTDDGGLAVLSVSTIKRPMASTEEFFEDLGERTEDANLRLDELSRNAAESIRRIRASGNSFYLQSVEISAVRAAYLALPAEWDKLLEGAENRTLDFGKRVRASEGLYLALCEVLLDVAPSKGVVLWSALANVSLTKFPGVAGISEFVHMVFRAPASAELHALRDTLATFENTSTDMAIFELVIAAQTNGCDGWLEKLILDDGASPLRWRQKRRVMLQAFSSYPDPHSLSWPSGTNTTSLALLAARVEKWRNRGALALLWWNKFVTAANWCEAFAAWHVFLSCADRRAFVWMKRESEKAFTGSDLDRLRRLHVQSNKGELERKLAAQEEKSKGLGNLLFGREAPVHWLAMDEIVS